MKPVRQIRLSKGTEIAVCETTPLTDRLRRPRPPIRPSVDSNEMAMADGDRVEEQSKEEEGRAEREA